MAPVTVPDDVAGLSLPDVRSDLIRFGGSHVVLVEEVVEVVLLLLLLKKKKKK